MTRYRSYEGYTKSETCDKCGIIHGLQIDHIVPRAQNGTDDPSNLQTLCYDCHKEKTLIDNRNTNKMYGPFQNLKQKQKESIQKWKERNIRAGREDIVMRRYTGREYDALLR